MIEASNLSKTFTTTVKDPGFWASVRSLFARRTLQKPAVKNVSFRVDEGEIVGVVGANGAGKTTLIKMLAGIIHPSAGTARVLGFDPWSRDNRLRRQISLIMGQKAQLWWDLPAGDCFLLLRDIYQIPEPDYRASLDKLSGLLEVRSLITTPIRKLSLGERMKMELIAALLHSPRVVFLDEPTIGLDLNAQRAIRDFILQYREEHRPAMLVTSHYMEDIERMCRRILIIRDGELIYDGSLERVVETYAGHKILTATLGEMPGEPCLSPALRAMGAVLECSRARVQVQVPRASVAAAAAELLRDFPVADLTIENPDIGAVIRDIIGSGPRGGDSA